MRIMYLKIALVTIIVTLCGGCASIISGNTDTVSINSYPVRAKFFIKDENGVPVEHGTTPAKVILERSDGYFDGQTYDITFTAEGYLPQSEKIQTSINPWYLGNFWFGGLLGFLVVDPATGAMWSLPDSANASLSPKPADRLGSETAPAPAAATPVFPAYKPVFPAYNGYRASDNTEGYAQREDHRRISAKATRINVADACASAYNNRPVAKDTQATDKIGFYDVECGEDRVTVRCESASCWVWSISLEHAKSK
jgi:hypothetical protein